jgi:DMSO/TMAO reductase YedYZ molybdopterin-dependent catalytic subunit
VPGLAPLVTPNRDFYRVDIALAPPALDPDDWTLEVTGMVRTPLRLSFRELLARDLVAARLTLACVSNPVGGSLVGTATWLGLPVRELLREAGPTSGADMVLSSGADGFSAGTPLAVLLDGRNALLAVGMNGAPLPQEHGFPVRLVVPGLYGYVSATKWLTRLEVTRFDRAEGYWTPRGWSAKGPVKLSSRIDVPGDGAVVAAGEVVVAGVAWEQHVGIARVEVSVDGGPWREAELGTAVTDDLWRQRRWSWAAERGNHRIRVRATDRRGRAQVPRVADVAPNGATGLHTVSVSVH